MCAYVRARTRACVCARVCGMDWSVIVAFSGQTNLIHKTRSIYDSKNIPK